MVRLLGSHGLWFRSVATLVLVGLTGCPDDTMVAETDTDIDDSPVCGNGRIEAGEACDLSTIPVSCTDLGFAGGTLSCDETCEIVAAGCTGQCGDGIVEGSETCDDLNTTPDDGCSSTCSVEPTWTCTGTPSVCTQACGNGMIDPGEGCDDFNTFDGDGCSMTCTVEPGWTCTAQPSICNTTCGNGVIDPGESCDDFDTFSGDGCSAQCTTEPGWDCQGQPSVCTSPCGNGVVDTGEQCDGFDFDGLTCQLLGFTDGNLVCNNCIVSTAECSDCGNGFVDGIEQCDGFDLQGFSCETLGLGVGELVCDFACNFDTNGCTLCGDGNLDDGEECDDGALNSDVSPDACRTDCTLAGCGDDVIDTGEECDDGILNSDVSPDACRTDCMSPSCGDDVVDTGEECDPPDGGVTCEADCTEPVACLNCGDYLAGDDGMGCCGSSDLFTGLELCVCGGMGSDCALSCIDTLCAGLDIAGDNCETCLMGDVDCNPQYGLCTADATAPLGPENTPEACGDGCNNDADLQTDCSDAGCFGIGVCADAETNCTDGADNDGDMSVDCADTDCAGDPACA